MSPQRSPSPAVAPSTLPLVPRPPARWRPRLASRSSSAVSGGLRVFKAPAVRSTTLPDHARLTLVGAAVSAAAVPLLAMTVGARLALRLAAHATDDYISSELLRLGQEVAWLPIRNGTAFAGLGLALLVLGITGSWLQQSLTGEGAGS